MSPRRRDALLPLGLTAGLAVATALLRAAASAPAPAPAPAASPAPAPPTPPEGLLRYSVRDADTGTPIPCKLTLVPAPGTPPLRMGRPDIGRAEGPAIAAGDRVFSLAGDGAVHVPFGTYDVWVSRGPEWDVWIARGVKITAAETSLAAGLHHVIDTAGWLSADFHVHASASFDSLVPMADRIHEFVADGVDLIVSTDHNVVTDYAPLIAELGVRDVIAAASGDEITTKKWGHFGAFPLPLDTDMPGNGAVAVKGRTAAAILGEVRSAAPAALIDVHHPRLTVPKGRIGYFDWADFDAAADRAGRAGFSWDFDAVEVLNGYQDAERKSVDRVIADWFALIEHGHLAAATGNSDTHHLSYNLGGYPRNYVALADDRPAAVLPAAVAAAVKARHSFFTTAPFVRVTAVGAGGVGVVAAAGAPPATGGIGDVVFAAGGKARLSVEVDAAPWVSVGLVRVYVGGKEAKRWTLKPSTAVVRLLDGFDVKVKRDSFVVVRVDGDKPLAPVVGGRADGPTPKSFGEEGRPFEVLPFAMTNPVFIDVDGNGKYDAPHAAAPAAAPPPL
ncbi:MAG TPA: CehA/McbA family metallohydrolase [Myxococcota bacterium]|jgi:hypothetical protein|nr:CehA/McbA family metallohydrolase [Myxococcota bacterium]